MNKRKVDLRIKQALADFAWAIGEAREMHGAHVGGSHEQWHAAKILEAKQSLRFLRTGSFQDGRKRSVQINQH